jgi:hypothetical protein
MRLWTPKSIHKMKKALLVIGEKRKVKGKSLDPSHNAFMWHLSRRANGKAEILAINYKGVLTNDLPDIESGHVIVLLFFPFQYWNKNIEVYDKDLRVYGDKDFGRDFVKFFQKMEHAIERKYRDKKIEYVNPPGASVLDRDKKGV